MNSILTRSVVIMSIGQLKNSVKWVTVWCTYVPINVASVEVVWPSFCDQKRGIMWAQLRRCNDHHGSSRHIDKQLEVDVGLLARSRKTAVPYYSTTNEDIKVK
jgi:hypothetical protein